MGKPRLSRRPRPDWRSKLNPLFLEAAAALKAALVRQKTGDSNESAEFLAKVEHLRQKFPTRERGAPLAADIIYTSSGSLPLSPNDIAKGILSWLHWNRFRTPLWQDGLRAKFGDIPASKRITQTIGDYDERRSNPNWQPRFKTDLDHAAIFEMGLALGLEVLNEEELADCFDALCPCGCPHSPDALRKQRDRFVHDLRKALVWELEVGPKLIKGSATRQS